MLITTTKTLQLRIEIGPNGPQCVMSTFRGFPQRTMETQKSVEQLSNWCLGYVYFMVSSTHNARHLYEGKWKWASITEALLGHNIYSLAAEEEWWKKLIRNRLNHKIWNNPSFHINLSYPLLFSFFGAIRSIQSVHLSMSEMQKPQFIDKHN